MAERSAEERIELWYQQLHQALQMTHRDWQILVMASGHATPQEYVENAATFLEGMQQRNAHLAQNSAEGVQDRLDASAERAREALRGAAVYETYEPTLYGVERYNRDDEYRPRLSSDDRPYATEAEGYTDDEYRPLLGPDDRPYATQYTGAEERAGADWEPGQRIDIDTSDTDMGPRWQDQLAVLEARLNALAQDFPERQAQGLERREDLSY